MLSLPRTLMERRTEPDGSTMVVFAANLEDVLQQYGTSAPDGVRLVVMGRVGHGGVG